MHVGAGLEALARGPGLEQRFLHQIVGQIAAAGERSTECPQVRDHRGKLVLEFRIGQRCPIGRRGRWSILVARFRQTRPHPFMLAASGRASVTRT
jgi:hypothetical protein